MPKEEDTPAMPPESHADPLPARLNAEYAPLPAEAAIRRALTDPRLGRIALVSSFGAQSVVLLHLISIIDRTLPVLFIDTEMLFAETYEYQRRLARDLGLAGLDIIKAPADDIAAGDPEGSLHARDPDACCDLRKVRPLRRALAGFDCWITGRRRAQGRSRRHLAPFERDGAGRLKFNPLAGWSTAEVNDYIDTHALPRHPLTAQGFHSIGCAPCTVAGLGRAGRWPDREKEECGIHIADGKVRRGPDPEAPVIVRDEGFTGDDLPPTAAILDLPGDTPPDALPENPTDHAMIRITFAAFHDGRGFSLARALRDRGYEGRLRAAGPLLAAQYPLTRRAGFDEVEIPAAHAARQPEYLWQAGCGWRAHDHRSRLFGWTSPPESTI